MNAPPNSPDLEAALLCTALCDASVLDVLDRVKPETFWSAKHGEVWRALLGCRARGIEPDPVGARDELVRTGRLVAAGGDETLFELTKSIGVSDVEARARELLDLAQRRDVIRACQAAAAKGYDRSLDHAAFLEWVQTAVFAAAISQSAKGGLERMDASATFQRIQNIAKGIEQPMGFSTGLRALDEAINGMEKGGLYILAARPGMGKTSLALSAFRAVTTEGTHSAAFFSLEMRKQKIIDRLLSIASGVPGKAMRAGRLQVGHMAALHRAAEEMSQSYDFIEDTPAMSMMEMRASLRRMLAKTDRPLGLVVVDHLGLAKSGKRTDSREQEVSEIARDLKVIAKEFDCPVLALCQLNRECEKSADKRPQLHHLRDSGEIEQSADTVLLIYRQGYYAAKKKAGQLQEDPRIKSEIVAGDDDGKAEIIRAKVREEEPGTTYVMWEGECTRFVDIARDYGTHVRGDIEQ